MMIRKLVMGTVAVAAGTFGLGLSGVAGATVPGAWLVGQHWSMSQIGPHGVNYGCTEVLKVGSGHTFTSDRNSDSGTWSNPLFPKYPQSLTLTFTGGVDNGFVFTLPYHRATNTY